MKNKNDVFFLEYLFRFRDIDVFVLCKLEKCWCHHIYNLNGKILNKEYLWKDKSSVLQTWHHKCSSQKKPNKTHSVVVMETLLAPVSFCYTYFQPFRVGERVLLGTDM